MGIQFSQYLIIFLSLLLTYQSAFTQSVSLPTSSLDVIHYSFRLNIHDYTNEIQGETDVYVSFKPQNNATVILHLHKLDSMGKRGMTVSEILFNDQPTTFSHSDHTLKIKLPPSNVNVNTSKGTFTIKYHGIPSDGLVIGENIYSDRTFFGDNWPNRAHFWLPTNDHPSDKATCEFIITAPSHYQVVSNGLLREESLMIPNSETVTQYKLTHWSITNPIPTKVMVFGAARFAIQYPASDHETPIQNWLYPEDRDLGFNQFSPTEEILTYYESILGPYPFKKLANVQSKTQYGGMENASAIFYNEQAITNRPSIETLIAHEIAHQWFGNSLTEKKWSDVWLSEGFSTYLTHLYIEHTYGEDSLAARMLADKDRIFSFHLQSPTSSVVTEDESNLFQHLNANTYQKGAWVLHMLRNKVGDEVFFKILRQFYQRFQYNNAVTDDFVAISNKISGQNLSTFFSQWLTRSDYPVVRCTWKYQSMGKKLTVKIEQIQSSDLYTLPLEIGLYSNKSSQPEIKRVILNEKQKSFTFKVSKRVKEVVVDPNTIMLLETTLAPK